MITVQRKNISQAVQIIILPCKWHVLVIVQADNVIDVYRRGRIITCCKNVHKKRVIRLDEQTDLSTWFFQFRGDDVKERAIDLKMRMKQGSIVGVIGRIGRWSCRKLQCRNTEFFKKLLYGFSPVIVFASDQGNVIWFFHIGLFWRRQMHKFTHFFYHF